MNPLLIAAVISYFLGSVPFGYLLVRIFHGEDVRQTGSGNIGATNVSRTSFSLGIITLLLDACKGLSAVLIARLLFPGNLTAAAMAALFAVISHVFPVWLKFRGGKGVATGLGSFILLAPKALLICIAIFVALVALFRYISLASVTAVLILPILMYAFHSAPTNVVLITLAASILIAVKHHANIGRLLSGSEPRFQPGHSR